MSRYSPSAHDLRGVRIILWGSPKLLFRSLTDLGRNENTEDDRVEGTHECYAVAAGRIR